MILLDAANISGGGGAVLLDYLITKLKESGVNFILLRDRRNKSTIRVEGELVSGNFLQREWLIKKVLAKETIDKVFCFGNYPPILPLSCPVFVYMHSPFLVEREVALKFKVKQVFLSSILRTSSVYIFQTNHIRKSFVDLYKFKGRTSVIPFFNEERINCDVQDSLKEKKSFIYNTFPYPHKNIERLIHCWEVIHEKKLGAKLYLTIPENTEYYARCLRTPSIVNLGSLTFNELLLRTAITEFCIYPSTKETLGLGMVEAAILGCKVIASNLPNTKEVIIPSMVFEPFDDEGIINAICSAIITKEIPSTKLLVKNQIDRLVQILS